MLVKLVRPVRLEPEHQSVLRQGRLITVWAIAWLTGRFPLEVAILLFAPLVIVSLARGLIPQPSKIGRLKARRPAMITTHGAVNAFGFTLCGLLTMYESEPPTH